MDSRRVLSQKERFDSIGARLATLAPRALNSTQAPLTRACRTVNVIFVKDGAIHPHHVVHDQDGDAAVRDGVLHPGRPALPCGDGRGYQACGRLPAGNDDRCSPRCKRWIPLRPNQSSAPMTAMQKTELAMSSP